MTNQVDLQQLIRHLDVTCGSVCHLAFPARRKFGRVREITEGLEGTEVTTDDFLVTGKHDAEHDDNLHAFLVRCRERNLVVNPENVRYKSREISLIGCLLTDEGITPDPKKVAAIIDMPMPTDVEGIHRLIGTVQYLGKFV